MNRNKKILTIFASASFLSSVILGVSCSPTAKKDDTRTKENTQKDTNNKEDQVNQNVKTQDSDQSSNNQNTQTQQQDQDTTNTINDHLKSNSNTSDTPTKETNVSTTPEITDNSEKNSQTDKDEAEDNSVPQTAEPTSTNDSSSNKNLAPATGNENSKPDSADKTSTTDQTSTAKEETPKTNTQQTNIDESSTQAGDTQQQNNPESSDANALSSTDESKKTSELTQSQNEESQKPEENSDQIQNINPENTNKDNLNNIENSNEQTSVHESSNVVLAEDTQTDVQDSANKEVNNQENTDAQQQASEIDTPLKLYNPKELVKFAKYSQSKNYKRIRLTYKKDGLYSYYKEQKQENKIFQNSDESKSSDFDSVKNYIKNKKILFQYMDFEFDIEEGILSVDIEFGYKNKKIEYKIKVNIDTNEVSFIEGSTNNDQTEQTNDSSNLSKPTTSATNNTTRVEESKLIYDTSNDYYKEADGLSGQELFNKLNEIQNKHNKSVKTYSALTGFYDNYSAFKDNYFEKDGTILDIYSENPNGADPYVYAAYGGNNGAIEGGGTNREHLIPQSWFNKNDPMRSDAHHVWPTDIKVNNIRSNYPHDNVVRATQTTQNNSKLGYNVNNVTVFEPVDAFKGDIARAYLYFVLSYKNKDIYNVKTNIFLKQFPYIKNHFFNTYLNWSKNDPIDLFDVKRNNEIAKYHSIGLRNPFSDYPNLIENLFGENPKPFINKGVLVDIKQ
ncbi:endonuclease [Mycoplasmopsis ciconiae]|uniref:Endonuclease n=1 Tax=Mycoplasmopsis ciconiae TaxID=561067 RepID=A0ABU7MLR8_9BACT|nr:endonuclease [Mycoplasmopsis ciconiae]